MLGFGIVFVFHLLLLPSDSSSYPSCTNSRVPVKLKNPLKFCPYNGTVCCNSTEDLRLQKEFQTLNFSNPECAALVKSILCSVCDPFSALIGNTGSASGNMPHLCNSSGLVKLHPSKNKFSTDFCTRVQETCGNASISNSTSSESEQQRAGMTTDGSSPSMLENSWLSKKAFCETFGGSSDDGALCFSKKTVSLINSEAPRPPNGLCLEKIGNGSYITMVPHPDGSNRVFLSNLRGKIWLANIPQEGSKGLLQVDQSKPFLDISHRVLSDTMIGIALHQNFVHNGRFFVSYYCDKIQHPRCLGRCSCNTDVHCDPSKITADNGIQPCQYHVVIAEYTANGTSSKHRLGKSANPSEVRRIFTFGIPSRETLGGQILIGPEDGYLYFMVGDNSRGDNQPSFAQNKGSILGKILRLDIDHISSAKEIQEQGLWGNYSIPRDNPYIDDKELAREIWALGLRLPWRCSFDSKRPSYLLCGDLGQDRYEEVDMIVRGGNYGWPVYEGPYAFQPGSTTRGNSSAARSITPIFPIMGYNHSEVAKKTGSASISGGFVYRSITDPCMYGRYLYSDLYAHTIWVGTEIPENSGKFTTSKIDFSCAHDSPMQCASSVGRSTLDVGYLASFAEDNRRDIYLLTSTGVYRVARPSRCNYQCSKESVAITKQHSSASICGHSWKMQLCARKMEEVHLQLYTETELEGW